MIHQHNMVGWFEIPVSDMDRAIGFYSKVFDISLEKQEFGEEMMAFFPWFEQQTGAGGSLNYHPAFYKPSENGVLIYFTTPSGNLDEDLKRVEEAGGKVLIPKKLISEDIGYMAVFLDSEGNRIALHSRT
ncbi:MAG TPA: VOC family protein [Bacteroidia bacterium]|nr:VOC family protein [Bacteroidia bacterium]HRS59829.1 VOC family protein [Bacteroidia bacterium]HRU69102.1 VOC family protein [Bacteroidia bacterium]